MLHCNTPESGPGGPLFRFGLRKMPQTSGNFVQYFHAVSLMQNKFNIYNL
jgi:hypothetical protein